MKHRVEWMDFCKFIAIGSVVWGHIGLPVTFDIYIHAWHMPIFFFLSGYLFNFIKYDDFKDLFWKKFKGLLVPYFAYGTIPYLFWNVFYFLTGNQKEVVAVKQFIKSILWDNATSSPFGAVVWFLTSLFLVELCFYLIVKITKDRKIIIGIIIFGFSLIGYFYPMVVDFRLPWGMDVSFTAIVFFGVGYMFKTLKNTKLSNFLYKPKLQHIIISFIVSTYLIYTNGYVNMRELQYKSYILFYLAAITSIIFFIWLSMYICDKEMIRKTKIYNSALYIGRNTIIVLLISNHYNRTLRIWLSSLISSMTKHQVYGVEVMITIVILLLMVPTSKFINKYLPFTLGRKC